MTNDEAISEFNEWIDRAEEYTGKIPITQQDKHVQAMKLAISALEHQKWIPCSERLPEKLKDVLIIEDYYLGHPLEHYRNIVISFYTGKNGRTHLWSNMLTQTRSRYRVLAWMPLPDPYKESVMK